MTDKKTTKSLERKTKKELIEIILRKDSVERDLRENNKVLTADKESLSEKTKTLNDEIDELANTSNSSYEVLCEDYQNACDENASLVRENIKLKGLNKFFIGLTIVMTFVCFIIYVL